MKPKGIKDLALKVSEGLLASVANLVLFQLFLIGAGGSGKTSRTGYTMFAEAEKNLETVNYQTIKQALAYLKRKGLIRSLIEPVITVAGRKRLAASIPQYLENRTWDKVIYLITYDVPEANRRFRDKLRSLLVKLGAASLQGSVWLTPYNPQAILKEFSQKAGFAGEIIVSCIGKDGYIGNENIKALINRVYQLEELNNLYLDFITKYGKSLRRKKDKWHAAVSYLSILQQDPQLPFELLPKDWAGDEAYKIYRERFFC